MEEEREEREGEGREEEEVWELPWPMLACPVKEGEPQGRPWETKEERKGPFQREREME